MIKEVGRLRPTDVYRLQRMYDYGSDLHRISLLLSEISGKNVQDIYEAFDIIAKDNYNFSKPFYEAQDMPFIPYEENETLQRYVTSAAKQTADEYINLTQHTAFAVFEAGGKSIAPVFAKNADKVATSLSDTYTELMDYAVTKVQTGMTDYRSAMREVMRGVVNSGIRTVDYATGYSRQLDTAVRQNVLWGLKQCNQNAADLIGEEFGGDGYEVSYHSHPRPSHADMGGRQYARGKARTVKGVYYPSFEKEAEPLLNDFGCLHFKFSILLGISRPAYSAEQLAEFKANDNRTFEFEGKEYTMYEGTQLQRKVETEIRKQKDIANIAKAGGDDDLRREAQEKINLLASKYAKLSEVSGLPTKVERMQVSGFRRVKAESTPSGQAKYKAIVNRKSDEKQYKRYKELIGINNVPENLDKFQSLKYNNISEWELFKEYIRSVRVGELSPLADFDLYKKINKEIDEKLIGITTCNGIKVTDKSSHFVARTIGSVEQRRNGVSVDESLLAITKPEKIDPIRENTNGNSQRFVGENAIVTINPHSGNLIQVNPRSNKKSQ